MADDQAQSNHGKLSARDAIHLKHATNEGITYRGYNARQVQALKTMSRDEWAEARKSREHLFRDYHKLSSAWYVLAGGLAVAAYLIPHWRGTLQIALVAVGVLVGGRLYELIGYREGFDAGYETGIEAGVNKTLGIDRAEALDIHHRSIEMKMDEMLIGGLEKGEPAEGHT